MSTLKIFHCLAKFSTDKQRYPYNTLFPLSEYLWTFAANKFSTLRLILLIFTIRKEGKSLDEDSWWKPTKSLSDLWIPWLSQRLCINRSCKNPKEKTPKQWGKLKKKIGVILSLQSTVAFAVVVTEAWTNLCSRAVKTPKSLVNIETHQLQWASVAFCRHLVSSTVGLLSWWQFWL